MIALALRTDKPEAEAYLYQDGSIVASEIWQAHRELSDTIHLKVTSLLKSGSMTLNQLERVIVFAGPGSFTGLRIGHSVANALAYGLDIPVVSAQGDSWLRDGLSDQATSFSPASPFYGAEAHITQPKK